MPKIFADVDISLDGFVAGENISSENPLGDGGEALIWYGDDVNDPDADLAGAYGSVDASVLAEAGANEGAVIMGRRTYEVSVGAWGENPPIHKPCFVLTGRPAPTVVREGGTTFTFVTGGPAEAIRLATEAAGGRDVGVMGGATTIRTLLMDGHLDELNLHIVPVLLGRGVRLFDGGAPPALEKVRSLDGERAVHLRLQVP